MAKLNQIIAIEKTVKSETLAKLTNLYQRVQKSPLMSGLSRTYKPKDETGDVFPDESTQVQINVENEVQRIAEVMTKLFDVVAVKDWTNCNATANVVVGGTVLLENVPSTYLLFLEKQLTDIHTFVSKLPINDLAERWHYDSNADCWATDPFQSIKTKKVMKNHVRFPGDDHHPPQVDTFTEDVVVGTWQNIKYSGALPASRLNELINRVEELQRAVKFAREQANMTEAAEVKVGETLFRYLFGK